MIRNANSYVGAPGSVLDDALDHAARKLPSDRNGVLVTISRRTANAGRT
jgi:hypothetical protein